MLQRPTYNTIDIAKMVAALFVVAIHAQPFSGITEVLVINWLARLAVPFFFVASAFFFFRKSIERQDWRHYVRRLGILYLFWFVIELPITLLHAFIEPETSFPVNLLRFVRGFFFGSTFSGSWFLMALMECVPLIFFLSKRFSTRSLFLAGLVPYGVVVLGTYYRDFLPTAWQLAAETLGHIEISFLSAFVFCVVGKYIAENEQRLRQWTSAGWFCVGSLVLSAAEVLIVNKLHAPMTNDFYFMLVPTVFMLFVVLLQHETLSTAIDYRHWRTASTVFYFSHFIFVFIFIIVNKHLLPIHPWVKFGSVLALCLLTSEWMMRMSGRKGWQWLRYGI